MDQRIESILLTLFANIRVGWRWLSDKGVSLFAAALNYSSKKFYSLGHWKEKVKNGGSVL